MGGDGVCDVSAGVGEGVGGKVNGTDLTSGSIARSGACGGGSSVGAETCTGGGWGFSEGETEEGLVSRSWVDGSEERIWKPSLKIRLRR